MIRNVFILVPGANLESPVKGAAALANFIHQHIPVTFVSLKVADEGFGLLNNGVKQISLSDSGPWIERFLALRRLLREAGGRSSVASISFCLSADIFNSCCGDLAVTCSSVRGNLPEVYPGRYGKFGRWIAYRHLARLRNMDHIVSMTQAMSQQLQNDIGSTSTVIGNFVDETTLAKFRKETIPEGPLRFVYTGSMIPAKQPQLLLQSIRTLQERGVEVCLDAFGDGPMLQQLREQAKELPVPNSVVFHGHINKPFEVVAAADILVLPSLTEGVSRSALEALCLGVPSVLRDVDGNVELVTDGVNGGLFKNDSELADVMLRTALWSRQDRSVRQSLVPHQFKQEIAAQKYLELLQKPV